VSLDVAKYVAHHLGSQMRTQVAHTSPLMSDQLMYNSGFGVLRQCDMPALLCESSFFTNLAEEQRLRDADYNLREAYGIYLGLCEYAYGGRPTQSLPTVERDGDIVIRHTALILHKNMKLRLPADDYHAVAGRDANVERTVIGCILWEPTLSATVTVFNIYTTRRPRTSRAEF